MVVLIEPLGLAITWFYHRAKQDDQLECTLALTFTYILSRGSTLTRLRVVIINLGNEAQPWSGAQALKWGLAMVLGG